MPSRGPADSAHHNWQFLPPMGIGQPGAPVQGGMPGMSEPFQGGAQAVIMRDPLDAERAMIGTRVPTAEYPSGYLGTIQTRREDRLLDSLKDRAAQRASQRGVHVGEKIDQASYFWPPEFTPDSGLTRESMAVPQPDGTMASPRFAPLGTIYEQLIADGGQLPTGLHGKMTPLVQNVEDNREVLKALLPDWSMR